jgi:hypothetical protein
MTTHDTFLKEAYLEWIRMSSAINDVVGELENEIQRMRERKVNEAMIEQKDAMIEKLIGFYNTTDQLITGYRIAMANKQAEVMIMNDSLMYAMRSEMRERIIARFTQEMNEIKERKQLKDELIEKLNG